MKKILFFGIAIAAVYFWSADNGQNPISQEIGYSSNTSNASNISNESNPSNASNSSNSSDQIFAAAFEERRNGYQVQGGGEVTRILSDDNDGSRHQRFVIRLTSGQTLLVSHNIDLAERINSLKVGDFVAFNGEYEWNAQGGVIHWTHHDPQGRHVAGWLLHNGLTYQ